MILNKGDFWLCQRGVGSDCKPINWHVRIHSGIKGVPILETTAIAIPLFLHFFTLIFYKPFLY